MSTTRAAAKYTAAGAVTALYGLVVYQALSGKISSEPIAPRKIALGAAGLAALTWVTALT